MVDFLSLVKSTGAYKIIVGEKKMDRLNHAYLLTSQDSDNLLSYLKIFAEIICCENGDPCEKCRTCKLIFDGTYPDVITYPKNIEKGVLTEDIVDLIDQSFIKPLESDKKVFIINHAETMNLASQNKLLKTLEEPPKNTFIILGATSDYALLPTIKSRVRKLEIPLFSNEIIFNAIQDNLEEKKLIDAINLGDGTVGRALKLYNDGNFVVIKEFACKILEKMNLVKDVLPFSVETEKLKVDFTEILSVLELILKDFLYIVNGRESLVKDKENIVLFNRCVGFNLGSIENALNLIVEANKRKKSNANGITEWLYFGILEGKHKWQKLSV